jgi:hypothetical protein
MLVFRIKIGQFFNFKITFDIGFDIIYYYLFIIFGRFFGCEIELHISKPYNLDFITLFLKFKNI